MAAAVAGKEADLAPGKMPAHDRIAGRTVGSLDLDLLQVRKPLDSIKSRSAYDSDGGRSVAFLAHGGHFRRR